VVRIINFENLEFPKKYLHQLYKLLRSETPDDAWSNLRKLYELEEKADRHSKTVLIEIKVIDT